MSDAPSRLIAVRRESRNGGRRAGDGDRRNLLRAKAAPHIAALANAGIAEVPTAALGEEDRPARPRDIGSVVTLPQANAMIIEPKPGMSTADVNGILSEEYIVMPDVELSLPTTAALGAPIPADRVQAASSVLPVEAGIRKAHEHGNRGKGVVVAVFDTGCDADHVEFADRTIDFGFSTLARIPEIRERRGFDTASHGTHVCGTIGGRTVGVAPEVDLIVASVIESERTSTSAARLYTALAWLLERIDRPEFEGKPVILSMSLGFTLGQIAQEADFQVTMDGIRHTLRQMLTEDDILPIIAIGNEGAGHVRAPGYYPEAVSVGAVDYTQELWPDSGGGCGPEGFELEVNPDVVGYGVGIVSSMSRDVDGTSWYGAMSGTSMATPYVAGVAALLAERHGVAGEALRTKLLDSALALPLTPEQAGRGLACAV
jgi:subtilisin family serine protease